MTISRAQMNRQLYQMGGSINKARDFFMREKGLDANQADNLITQGLQAFNTVTEPQSMMQMASNGGRIGYQMGGISSMPMDFGQPLQVPQQTSMPMQPMMSSPMANYGQTPLMMQGGGIARLGYQMGGEAMMQPQMGGEMSMPQMNEQQALETIIQLLIQEGIDPETALQLAAQILQIFAQGGEPAVEAFADQLEQQEQAEAMASGGIAGYAKRQGYGFGGKLFKAVTGGIGSAVKGVSNAIKSVAKSPIGKIALTVAAGYFLGPAGGMFGGAGLGASLTTNAFLAGAINAGAANLLVQGVTTGKFNPKEALLAGALGGVTGYMSPTSVGIDPTTGQAITTTGTNITANLAEKGIGNTTLDTSGFGTDYGPTAGLRTAAPVNDITGARSDLFTLDRATLDPAAGKGSQIYNPPTNVETKPGFFQDTFNKAQTGIQNLYKDPIGTIKGLGTAALDYTKKEPGTALALAAGAGSLATLGAQLGVPRNEGEDDDSYAKRLEGVQGYITQYGKNLSIKDPYFYQREGAVNPFAPTMAAQGGIMGYRRGGSMVPPARQIEGGVIELDARKTGGYIPYGKKERVDDVPAMLAKDEFVFTSRAVKAAGGGSAKRGAARMYALMKQLEGARA